MANTKCGFEFLRFYPKWLQIFANANCYVILYALLGMLWHTMICYFIGTLSTIQKNFQMSSRDLALISTSAEFGGVISNLFLTYYVSKKHPIRCITFGMYLIGITCFVKVLPYHFSDIGSEVKMYTREYNYGLNYTDFSITNRSLSDFEEAVYCRSDEKFDVMIFYLFVVSHFFIGIGNTLYWTTGITYMDDNSSKKAFPLLFSIAYAIRFLGQTFGFFLSSFTLRIFLYPNLTPIIDLRDPKWIGAWWIGWYVLGIWYFILGFLFSLFPRRLPSATEEIDAKTTDNTISFKDYYNSVKRIITNRVIFLEALSAIFFNLGLSAYGTFFPKYIESQFQFSPTKSTLLLGYIGIISKACGLLLNGVVVSTIQPTSRFLIGFNIIAETISVLGHMSYVLIGCASAHIEGHWNNDHSWNITEECNAINGYSCDTQLKYSPVCDISNKKQYYSACHAGCTTVSLIDSKKVYYNCNCLPSSGSVSEGFCPTDCTTNLVIFIIILTFMKFLRGTIRTIKPLIKLRSVDKGDKTMTMGISQSILQMMGLMPAPIIYGMIMDYSCIMWEKDCNGFPGQCWLYDQQRLRNAMNYTATSFLTIGIIIDCFVWYSVKTVKMFDEEYHMKEIGPQLDNQTNMTTNSENQNTKL